MKNINMILAYCIDFYTRMTFPVKIICEIAIILLVILTFNRCQHEDTPGKFIQASKQYDKEVKMVLRENDSLQKKVIDFKKNADNGLTKINILETKINAAQTKVNSYKSQLAILQELVKDTAYVHTLRDSVVILRKVIPVQDSIISNQDSVITIHKNKFSGMVAVVAQKDSIIDNLTVSNGILLTTIKNTPKLKNDPNKLFKIIPMPSRKTALITGFIGGVIVTAGVIR